MNWQAASLIVSLCSLLVAGGLLAWIMRARQALQFAELDKRYATHASVAAEVKAMKDQVTGARAAVRKDMAEMEKRVDRSDAKADLAVKNADTAIHEAQETRALLEHYHDRIEDDFAKPVRELTSVLGRLSESVAALKGTQDTLMTMLPTNRS